MQDIRFVHTVCFTQTGAVLQKKLLLEVFGENPPFGPNIKSLSCFGEAHPPLSEFVQSAFEKSAAHDRTALIFIGAVGIAVRSIAPFVRKKTSDPAVLCIDEKAAFVIPILSGHIGGANELARKIAEKLGATPVITTATDLNGKWAVDSWCASRGIEIKNPGRIKEISSHVLRGEKVLSIGVGCKKGTDSKKLDGFIERIFLQNDLDLHLAKSISSIDIKKDERAILDFSKSHGLEAKFYSKEALEKIRGDFSESEFVREKVGVGCVCERAAVAGIESPILLLKKIAEDGMTISVAV